MSDYLPKFGAAHLGKSIDFIDFCPFLSKCDTLVTSYWPFVHTASFPKEVYSKEKKILLRSRHQSTNKEKLFY